MKRSRINDIMAEADEMIRSYGFTLPPWAYWTPEEFQAKKDVAAGVISARNGWDITDYGAGDYDKMGLFLFTLRNGRLEDRRRCRRVSAPRSRQAVLPGVRHLSPAPPLVCAAEVLRDASVGGNQAAGRA